MTNRAIQLLALCYLSAWLLFNIDYVVASAALLPFQSDFNHYFGGAWLLASGRNPYCIPFDSLPLPGMHWDEFIRSPTNTPFHLLLTAPLTAFPIPTAWVVWIVISIASGAASVWITLREFTELRRGFRAVIVLFGFFGSYAFLDNIFYSQVQLIILFLVTLGWSRFRNQHPITASVYWGLALALKPLTFLLIALLILQRRFIAATVAVFTAAIATLASSVLGGFAMFSDYIRCALPIVQSWGIDSFWNLSIAGFLYRISLLANVHAEPFFPLFKMLVILLSLGVTWSIARTRAPTMRDLDFQIGIAVILGALSLDVAWPSYLVLGLPLALCVWNYELFGRRTGFYLFLLWASLNLKPLFEYPDLSMRMKLVRSLLIPALCLFAISSVAITKRSSTHR